MSYIGLFSKSWISLLLSWKKSSHEGVSKDGKGAICPESQGQPLFYKNLDYNNDEQGRNPPR